MNDKSNLILMLDRASINYFTSDDRNQMPAEVRDKANSVITITTKGTNNHGYAYFISEFYFDGNDNLIATGIWE